MPRTTAALLVAAMLALAGCAELDVALNPAPVAAELLAGDDADAPAVEVIKADPPAGVAEVKPEVEAEPEPDDGPEIIKAAALAPLPGDEPEPEPAPTPPVETPPSPTPPAPTPADSADPDSVVATVGDEAITLPDLTAAIKERIGLLPGGAKPTRRQIINLARTTLELMILRSLVLQEARARYPDPADLDAKLAAIDARWPTEELPRLVRKGGVADEPALAAKLAADGRTVDDLREVHRIRSLAREMIRDEPGTPSLAEYLDRLRQKTPVTSVMTASELAARGEAQARSEAESSPNPAAE